MEQTGVASSLQAGQKFFTADAAFRLLIRNRGSSRSRRLNQDLLRIIAISVGEK
jgi:hypothetical protein